MHYSGYQIESVLRRLRRLHGLLWRRNGAPPSADDEVSLTERAQVLSHSAAVSAARPPPEHRIGVDRVADGTRFHHAVERELERRAGSFMQPPLSHAAGPWRFPRAKQPPPRE